jgi:hypothetical protein
MVSSRPKSLRLVEGGDEASTTPLRLGPGPEPGRRGRGASETGHPAGRRRAWTFGVVAVLCAGMLGPIPLAAQEKAPTYPVEEWQMEGILAALQDGYPEVRDEAIKKLAELLGSDAEVGIPERSWNDRSLERARKAVPFLFACLSDRPDRVRIAALTAIGRLSIALRPHDQDALRDALKSGDIDIAPAAAEAMARLGIVPRPEDRDVLRNALRDALRGGNISIASVAAEAMARLGVAPRPEDRDALRDALKSHDPAIAEAMARLGAPRPEDRDALRDALKSGNSSITPAAAEAMARLGIAFRPEDRDALRDAVEGESLYRAKEVAEAMARLGIAPRPEDRDAFRDALKDGVLITPAAAEAMARLGIAPRPEDRDAFRAALLDRDQMHRDYTASALSHFYERVLNLSFRGSDGPMPLRRAELLGLLKLTYEDRSTVPHARWLAHYVGGGQPEFEILCCYLGRPDHTPEIPKTSTEAKPILEALKATLPGDGKTGKVSDDVRHVREDAASWIARIVTQEVKDWKVKDVDFLRTLQAVIALDPESYRMKAYADAIGRVIEPYDLRPSPLVRTLLAFLGINVVAIGLLVLLPGRGGWERWLPFAGYAGAGAASWAADAVAKLHLLPWMLGGLLVGEVVVLIGAGVFSPAVLRQVAKVEPLNRLAVPLALRLPRSRRRIFREYVATVRSQLERDRRRASAERYLALPAEVRTEAHPDAVVEAEPADVVLESLTGGEDPRAHVLIEAPGGRGKSAMLREVVARALEQFERRPTQAPLPVLLAGGGESLEAMVTQALGPALIAPEVLEAHLESGDFVLVLDSVSETGPPAKVLEAFLQGRYGGSTPLLLGSRPSREIRHVVEGAARWMVVEPLRLDEATLGAFVAHYEGGGLDEGLKPACRGPDGTYLPILVRMAMTIPAPRGGRASVADIYRSYVFRLFEAQFPDEAARFERLREAGRWCLETYWRDGHRRRIYDAGELQRRLKEAGVLVPADGLEPPREVQFFHDSMQSYLTAFGLAELDRAGYPDVPRPTGDDGPTAWDRGRVLLRAAADPDFGQSRSDILLTSGTELFQMILATFPANDLRDWLRDETRRWAADHGENLRRKDVLAAMPPDVREQVQSTRGVSPLLEKAADVCFDADHEADTVESLGRLYAGMATLVHELTEGGGEDIATPAAADTLATAGIAGRPGRSAR